MFQQISRNHDHTRCAETTLQTMTFFKGFLQRMQFAVLGKALNRSYFAAIRLHGQHGAAFGGFAIYMNGTGAAAAGIATNVGTGETQYIAEVLHQQQTGFNLVPVVLTIYRNRNRYKHGNNRFYW
jgi:hypothetical protein